MTTAYADAPTHRVKTSLPAEFQDWDDGSPQPLANFLGLFSIGLGLAEATAPNTMADLTGVRHPTLLRAYGLREIAAGVGILANRRPAGWLWARVAGDVLDLATLGATYAHGDGRDRRRSLISLAAVAGVTALDVIAAGRHGASN